mmetsp:Transcript_14152/g.19501  ORF Transcript_14152/g.19501 Transcript_14152/m.19501 type:complete len:310 (-) Transcript_14152:1035-1964(-)
MAFNFYIVDHAIISMKSSNMKDFFLQFSNPGSLNSSSLNHQSVPLVGTGEFSICKNNATNEHNNKSCDRGKGNPSGEGEHVESLFLWIHKSGGGVNLVKFVHDGNGSQALLKVCTLFLGDGNLNHFLTGAGCDSGYFLSETVANLLQHTAAIRGVDLRTKSLSVFVTFLSHSSTLAVLPERHLRGSSDLVLAVRGGEGVMILSKALQHSGTTMLNLGLGADLVHITLAGMSYAKVHFPVGGHTSLLLQHLGLARLRDVRLLSIGLEAAEESAHAGFYVIAVDLDFLLASLEARAKAHIISLHELQFVLH